MKNSITIFISLLFISLSACSISVHKPTKYSGKTTAVKPYVGLEKMNNLLLGCDRSLNSCTLSTELNPIVHNPLNDTIEGQTICEVSIIDDSFGKYSYKKSSGLIRMLPRSSVMVSVRGSTYIPGDKPSHVEASCWFKYRKIQKKYLGSSSF